LEGFLFGAVDNGIVLIGMYLGIDIEGWLSKKLGKKSNPLLGAVVGATGFNTVSDGVAAAIDPATKGMAMGIIFGCALIMLFIPVIESIRSRKKNN
jgi:hypothetical protein